MNIAKNMEIIFVAAIALIGASSLATAGSAERGATPTAVAAPAKMQVVTVVGKRLSAAEKAGNVQ